MENNKPKNHEEMVRERMNKRYEQEKQAHISQGA